MSIDRIVVVVGNPKLALLRESKAAWHYAKDCVLTLIHLHGSAQHMGIPVKDPMPKLIADQHYTQVGVVRAIDGIDPTELRLGPEDFEELRISDRRVHFKRNIVGEDAVGPILVVAEGLKALALIPPVDKIGHRHLPADC